MKAGEERARFELKLIKTSCKVTARRTAESAAEFR